MTPEQAGKAESPEECADRIFREYGAIFAQQVLTHLINHLDQLATAEAGAAQAAYDADPQLQGLLRDAAAGDTVHRDDDS